MRESRPARAIACGGSHCLWPFRGTARRYSRAKQLLFHPKRLTFQNKCVCLQTANNVFSHHDETQCLRKSHHWLSLFLAGARALHLDTTTYQKIDSLRWLLDQKLDNTLSVMTLMANGSSDSYVQRKVEQLRERRDSVVVRPKSVETKQDSTVVVEVVKTRKGFFRRLADAFRKPRTDTVKVTKHEGAQETT